MELLTRVHMKEASKQANLGPMAYSMQIIALWSEVLAHIFRSSHMSTDRYLSNFDAFYDAMML